MFDENWSAEEELMLIGGLEKFGFGNWLDIAEHMGTGKTKEECEAHYQEKYLNNLPTYLPKSKLLARSSPDSDISLRYPDHSFSQKKVHKSPDLSLNPNQNPSANPTQNPSAHPNPTATPSEPSSNVRTITNIQRENNGNVSEIVGYMPKRGDFDIEYDNEAELILAEMEFHDDDNDEDSKMKLKVLDIYNARLDERIKRKKFVIDRGLLDFNKQLALDKSFTKEEKEIHNLMKVFARFNSPEEHERLVAGIIRERQLRARIEELKHYKRMGLMTFEQVEHYLAEKRKRDDSNTRKQMEREQSLLEGKSLGSMGSMGLGSMGKGIHGRRSRGNFNDGAGESEGIKEEGRESLGMEEKERAFCEKTRLSVQEYLALKTAIVRKSVIEGSVKRDDVSGFCMLDKDRAHSVFDFLVHQNVI